MRRVIQLSHKDNKQVTVNAILFGFCIENKHLYTGVEKRGCVEISKLDKGSEVKHSDLINIISAQDRNLIKRKFAKFPNCQVTKVQIYGSSWSWLARLGPNTKNEFVNINLQTIFGCLSLGQMVSAELSQTFIIQAPGRHTGLNVQLESMFCRKHS